MIRAARRRVRHVNDAFEILSETCREKGREHSYKGINKNRLNKSAFSLRRSKWITLAPVECTEIIRSFIVPNVGLLIPLPQSFSCPSDCGKLT